jgi:hypothetical protein
MIRPQFYAYHFHIDAAYLPRDLEEFAKESLGFRNDDFEHEVMIKGVRHKGRHFTRKIQDRSQIELVKEIAKILVEEAERTRFEGFFQAEFVMSEKMVRGEGRGMAESAPFSITSRKLDPLKGETFKKHELHLEFEEAETSSSLIEALGRSGMLVSRAPGEVTLTASGYPNDIRAIKKSVEEYLATSSCRYKGIIVHEAALFSSLHRMEVTDLPMIVDHFSPGRSFETHHPPSCSAG